MGLNRLLNAWLLQHYALAVWLSTGVNFRRRQPAPFAKLVPFIRTAITGQIMFSCGSIYLLLERRTLPVSVLVLSMASVMAFLLLWALPWLDVQGLKRGVPAAFRRLSEPHRLRYAWAGLILFWAAFCSIFFVAASLGPLPPK